MHVCKPDPISLIHRYWFISDEKLLSLVRENKTDFISFIEAIENYIKNRAASLGNWWNFWISDCAPFWVTGRPNPCTATNDFSNLGEWSILGICGCSNIAVVSMSYGPNRTASFTDFNEFLKFTNLIKELNLPIL